VKDLPPLKWFRVRDSAGLERIPAFIKSLGKYNVNTFSYPRQDRKGDWILMLGWDDRPDSDWGRFKGNRAALWFASEELSERAFPYVRRGLGWPAIEEQDA
jgi:hypothetical protein